MTGVINVTDVTDVTDMIKIEFSINKKEIYTLFKLAYMCGSVDTVKNIIKYIDIDDLNISGLLSDINNLINKNGFDNMYSIFEILLDKGININVRGNTGKYPLFYIISINNIEHAKKMLILFLKNNANINEKYNGKIITDTLFCSSDYRSKELYNTIITNENRFYVIESGHKRLKCMVLENNKKCAICLDDIIDDTVAYLTKCLHLFHQACIDIEDKCPICREAP